MICASEFGINRITSVSDPLHVYHKSARSKLSLGRTSLVTFAALFALSPAIAGETVLYSYDALGRLKKAETSGSVNNGLKTEISMDHADNRTNYKVTGSGGSGSGETPPSFSINDASATEGGNLTFTVNKSGVVSNNYSVSYATANNTALAGSDFTTKSGQLTFSPSQTSQTVVISSIDNSVVESTENFYLNLSGSTGGATISDSQGVGTITDNDSGSSNGSPVAVDDYYITFLNLGSRNVVANDSDPDGDTLTVTSATPNGSFPVSIVGGTTISFSGITTNSTVTYVVSDGNGGTDTGTLIIEYSCGPFC